MIGAGAVTVDYHLPALSAAAGVEVAWVLDLSLARARQVAANFRVPQAFTRLSECSAVDAALVAVPLGQRAELVPEACARGWALLCEKPFAFDRQQHLDFLGRAAAARVPIAAGFMRRGYWSTITARKLLRAGLLGHPRSVFAASNGTVRGTGRGRGWYQADPRQSGGGVLVETGSHLIDQLLFLLDVESFRLDSCRQRRALDIEYDTQAEGSLRCAGGADLPFQLRVSALTEIYNGIVVRCDNGELRIGLQPDSAVVLHSAAGEPVASFNSPLALMPAVFAAFRSEWDGLRASLAGLSPEHATGLLTTDFLDACRNTAAWESPSA